MKTTLMKSLASLCLLISVTGNADGRDGSKVWHTLPDWNVTLDLQSHSGDYTLYVDGAAIGPLNNLDDTYWQLKFNAGVHEVILEGGANQSAGRVEAWLNQSGDTTTHFLAEAGTNCEDLPGGIGPTVEATQTGPSRYAICQAASGVVIHFRFVVGSSS